MKKYELFYRNIGTKILVRPIYKLMNLTARYQNCCGCTLMMTSTQWPCLVLTIIGVRFPFDDVYVTYVCTCCYLVSLKITLLELMRL